MTGDDVTALGKQILEMERDFNANAGFNPKDDHLPTYMKSEALPPHNITFEVPDDELDEVF